MTAPHRSAQEIYQRVLDEMDAQIEAGEFEAFAMLVVLPHTIQTQDHNMRIETRAQLRAAFDDMRNRLTMRNIAHRTRHCDSARFLDADTIEGRHRTWLVTDDESILESYHVCNTLRRADGIWCVVGNSYAGPPDTLPAHMANEMARSGVYADVAVPHQKVP